MADIHILEGSGMFDTDKLYQYRVIYHIPIDNPKPEVAFPTFESAIPNISVGELDAIKAGTLAEIVKSERYNTATTTAEQSQRLKDKWITLKGKVNLVYPIKYKFYGYELNVT